MMLISLEHTMPLDFAHSVVFDSR